MRTVWVAAACVFAVPSSAGAFSPSVEVTVSGDGPGAPAAVTSVLRQPADAAEPIRTVEAVLPGTFGFSRAFAVAGCGADDERAGSCPEASRIGRVSAVSSFGVAEGTVHLSDDFRLLVLLRAYGGLVRLSSQGVLEVRAGQEVLLRFDGLPQLPASEIRLAIDGGDRSPLALPRTCGKHVLRSRVVSYGGAEVRGEHPVVVSGCPSRPAVRALRASGRTVRWRVSGASVAGAEVEVQRLRDGAWRRVGRVRRASGRTGVVRVGRGRHRVLVRAVGPDGQRSGWRSVDLR